MAKETTKFPKKLTVVTKKVRYNINFNDANLRYTHPAELTIKVETSQSVKLKAFSEEMTLKVLEFIKSL